MKIIYWCVFFLFAQIHCAVGQDKCKVRIDHRVIQDGSKGYLITLQSQENLRNTEVELYDLYEGKLVVKKTLDSSLRNEQTVFTGIKPSLYLIYVKYDGCPKKRSLGGIEGIKVGTIE